MSDFLRIVRGSDHQRVSTEEAYVVFKVLVPVLLAVPDNEKAAEISSRTIGRMSVDDLLTVVLDWWFDVWTNAPSPHKQAFRRRLTLSAPLKEAMEAVAGLRDQGVGLPPARWVRAALELEEGLRSLDEILDLDSYGSGRFKGERRVWDDLKTALEPVTTALRNGEPTEPFEHDVRAYRKAMKAWAIEEFSPKRSNEMLKRAGQCVDRLNAIVKAQSLVEPWLGRMRPEAVEIPREVLDALGPLGPVLLDPVTATGVTSPEDWLGGAEALAARFAEITSTADEQGLSLLASLAGSWLTVAGSRIPALNEMLTRRAELEARIDRLRQGQVDVDEVEEAELYLLEDEVSNAERLVAWIEEQRKQQRRGTALASTIERLRAVSLEGSTPEHWNGRLDEAVDMLASGDHTAVERTVQMLDREYHMFRRSAAVTELHRMRDELDRLDAPMSVVVELDEYLQEVETNPERAVDDAMLRRTRDRLDSLDSERRRAVERCIEEAHDALETDLIPPEALPDLELRLAEVESELRTGEPVAAAQLADELMIEIQRQRVHRWTADQGEKALIEHIVRYCTQQLQLDSTDVRRLYVAAKTKPFVIVAGLTGSGKSTIARLFAGALSADAHNGRFRRIAVRPDWIDQSDVLGSINPFSRRFEPGWLAEVARHCERAPDELHVVLLDEMNLAPVEQYLAEFLSAIEEARSGSDTTTLRLYSSGANPENANEWPATLAFPPNLLVIGTVNVDETTRVLSERVLDRANVLQLSVEISNDHHHTRARAVQPWSVPFREWQKICTETPDEGHHEFLVDVGDILQTMGIGLGPRAHVELERFIANSYGVLDPELSLDVGVLQRIVPKVRGFKRDLHPCLVELHDVLSSVDCQRSARVIARWLEPDVSDDEYLDGTDARIGLLR